MNKKNIIALAILSILLVIFFLSKGRENIEKRSGVFNFKHAEISRIQIIQPYSDSLEVAQENKVWTILHPRYVSAKASQIQRFFDEFLSLTISNNSISDSPDRQTFYQVDEQSATRISIFGKKDKLLRTVYYGRNSQNPQIAYIRLKNDNNIYQINNIYHVINPSLSSWREDRIITFTQSEIMKIQTSTYELSNETGMWMVTNKSNGEVGQITPTNNEFTRIMNSITELRTSIFFDDVFDEHEENLSTPALEIMITLTDGDLVYLRLAQNDANSYILQKNETTETLYRLTTAQFNSLNANLSLLFEDM